MTKKMKSTNWYIKLEDKWVYSEYNRVDDPDQNKTTLFHEGTSEGQNAIGAIRGSIRVMIVSSLLFICAYISPYPLAIYPAWLCFAAWYWKYAHEYKMSSGYPYLEPSDGLGVMFIIFFSIPFFFIGYLIMNTIGGLVEGRLNTALVQFVTPILLFVAYSTYVLWKDRQTSD